MTLHDDIDNALPIKVWPEAIAAAANSIRKGGTVEHWLGRHGLTPYMTPLEITLLTTATEKVARNGGGKD